MITPKYTYYYGLTPDNVTLLSELTYENAIKYKIHFAKELLKDLLQVDYMSRDNTRITAIYKAIKFNQSLLEEILWTPYLLLP